MWEQILPLSVAPLKEGLTPLGTRTQYTRTGHLHTVNVYIGNMLLRLSFQNWRMLKIK